MRLGTPVRRSVVSRFSRRGGWRLRRLWRRFWWGDAEGVVDGFEKDGHVNRLVNIGYGAGFEGGIAITDGSTRAEDDDGDGARVEQHRETL